MPFALRKRSRLAKFVLSASILLHYLLYLGSFATEKSRKIYMRLERDNPIHAGAPWKEDVAEQSQMSKIFGFLPYAFNDTLIFGEQGLEWYGLTVAHTAMW